MMMAAMDEEQYMEHFAMDADFDDGRWIKSEFYYHNRKEQYMEHAALDMGQCHLRHLGRLRL